VPLLEGAAFAADAAKPEEETDLTSRNGKTIKLRDQEQDPNALNDEYARAEAVVPDS
jgi:hypothetical protein